MGFDSARSFFLVKYRAYSSDPNKGRQVVCALVPKSHFCVVNRVAIISFSNVGKGLTHSSRLELQKRGVLQAADKKQLIRSRNEGLDANVMAVTFRETCANLVWLKEKA
jgi:hypothetical protein